MSRKTFETIIVNLDTPEKRIYHADYLRKRHEIVEDVEAEIEDIYAQMMQKCPELANQLLAAEAKKKRQKKYLAESKKGCRFNPPTIYVDVKFQKSNKPGYVEAIDNYGFEQVLVEESGTIENIEPNE